MGKVNFTAIQRLVFAELGKNKFLRERFYFTGGTALSVFYLRHRYSEDLDFFSEKPLDEETTFMINAFMGKVSGVLKSEHRFTQRETVKIFEFEKRGKLALKVDFACYPYPRLEKGLVSENVAIDSLRDIATNKLLTICERSNIKDFVDYYFLQKEFTLWDLVYGVERKFNREIDILLLGTEFLKVQEFDYLPKMIAPLELMDLKEFFKEKAKEVALRAVVP